MGSKNSSYTFGKCISFLDIFTINAYKSQLYKITTTDLLRSIIDKISDSCDHTNKIIYTQATQPVVTLIVTNARPYSPTVLAKSRMS